MSVLTEEECKKLPTSVCTLIRMRMQFLHLVEVEIISICIDVVVEESIFRNEELRKGEKAIACSLGYSPEFITSNIVPLLEVLGLGSTSKQEIKDVGVRRRTEIFNDHC